MLHSSKEENEINWWNLALVLELAVSLLRVFELDGEKAVVKDQTEHQMTELLTLLSCPVLAIILEDENGKQIFLKQYSTL